MADRPNNFGEVLFKALGNTAKEAPSIFDNAATRKKAEALHLFDAMLKLQDAQRSDQQLKMQQAQQQQQAQIAQLTMAKLNADIESTRLAMSQSLPEFTDAEGKRELARKTADYLSRLEGQIKIQQKYNVNDAGNAPSNTGGAGGQFLLTPDDLVRRGQSAQADKVGVLDKQIQTLRWMPTKADEVAKLRAEREQIASPAWLNASLSAPSDSLGIPQFMINPNAQAPQTFGPVPKNNSYDFDAWGKQTFGAEWDKATPEKKQKAIAKRKLELGIQ